MTTYRALTGQEAVEYARNINGLFSEGAELISREIGDGNLNLVFHIQDRKSDKSIIFKQALPYARIVGESWPLTIDRNRIESEMLLQEGRLCPDLVPKVYHYDPEMALTIMEDLSDHVIMRKGLIEKNRYPLFADHIAQFMAKTLFYTSDLYLAPDKKKEEVKRFTNPELCKITEDLVYSEPYYDAANNHFNPEITDDVKEILWENKALKLEVAKLKKIFMTKAEALIHGDLHTGSIFVKEDSTKVIDPEFAYYGPMGYDIGALLGNLILNHNAQEGLSTSEEERSSVRDYLLTTLVESWNRFESYFRQYWNQDANELTASWEGFQDAYIAEILEDSIAIAGLECIRRTVGLAHVADQEQIADLIIRAQSERLSLKIGAELILKRKELSSIEAVRGLVENMTNKG